MDPTFHQQKQTFQTLSRLDQLSSSKSEITNVTLIKFVKAYVFYLRQMIDLLEFVFSGWFNDQFKFNIKTLLQTHLSETAASAFNQNL